MCETVRRSKQQQGGDGNIMPCWMVWISMRASVVNCTIVAPAPQSPHVGTVAQGPRNGPKSVVVATTA